MVGIRLRLGDKMIEAVNSVLSNAPLVRAGTGQVDASRSLSSGADKVQAVTSAPFISPVIAMNVEFDTAVLEIRDSGTGEVVKQIPSDNRLEAQRRFSEESLQTAESENAREQAAARQASASLDTNAAQTVDQPVQEAANPARDVDVTANTNRAAAAQASAALQAGAQAQGSGSAQLSVLA